MSPDEVNRDDFMWLVGLLEGEGSFSYTISKHNRVRIILAIGMGDEDIIEKVAKIFGSFSVLTLYDPRPNNNVIYRTSIEGLKALLWMKKIYPLMSKRRKRQIALAIEKFEAYRASGIRTHDRLGYEKAELIRKLWKEDRTITQIQLGKRFGVTQSCVGAILKNKVYKVKGSD